MGPPSNHHVRPRPSRLRPRTSLRLTRSDAVRPWLPSAPQDYDALLDTDYDGGELQHPSTPPPPVKLSVRGASAVGGDASRERAVGGSLAARGEDEVKQEASDHDTKMHPGTDEHDVKPSPILAHVPERRGNPGDLGTSSALPAPQSLHSKVRFLRLLALGGDSGADSPRRTCAALDASAEPESPEKPHERVPVVLPAEPYPEQRRKLVCQQLPECSLPRRSPLGASFHQLEAMRTAYPPPTSLKPVDYGRRHS